MKLFKKENNQSGFTLIEVISSLVIITIILLSFLTLLLNSAKTTKTSETILDSTYYVQTEMEKLYSYAKQTSYSEKINLVKNTMRYEEDLSDPSNIEGEVIVFIKEPDDLVIENEVITNPKFKLKLIKYQVNEELKNTLDLKEHLSESTMESSLSRVIIELYDNDTNVLKAKVENTIEWGSSSK